jgi:O-antigen/teichoic acid export membrane protein
LSRDVSNHRLGAYVYGFLSGAGLTLLVWGVALISWFPSRNATESIALTLFGVFLFAFGGCREAYLRGSLSMASTSAAVKRKETAAQTGTHELVLYEQDPHNQA